MPDKEEKRAFIRNNYAQIAQGNQKAGCCCGGSCGCGGNDTSQDIRELSIKIGYNEADLSNTPVEANMGLGCGNPVALASLKEGETVLDLGCGGGLDCFLARRCVGASGFVIGVDMTPDMIQLARRNAEKSGYTNIDFRLGEIEHLPVADEVVDIILSNCVINLSPDKQQVYHEAYRVLKPGGRLSISDIASISELPEDVKKDLTLISSCIGGAEPIGHLKNMLINAGFQEVCITRKENSDELIKSWAPDTGIENLVASFIIEAVK